MFIFIFNSLYLYQSKTDVMEANIKFENVKTKTGGYIRCLSLGGLEVARLTYCFGKAKRRLIIHHLKVMKTCQGKGYANLLMMRFMEFAKSLKMMIYPYCNYARDILEYATIPATNQYVLIGRSEEF